MKLATPITKVLQKFPGVGVVTTQDRGSWHGVAIEQIEFLSEFSMQKPAHDYHVVCHMPNARTRLIQKRDGKIHEGMSFSGMSTIRPRGCSAVYEGEPISVTCLHIPDELLSRAANEINGCTGAKYEIVNTFQTYDPTIGHLIDLFLDELNRPVHPAQALISDAISGALAGHLLRSYNAFDKPTRYLSRLGPHTLSRVIGYIEDHIEATIRLDDLANIAGVSRFHFSRLFKSGVGISPMAYVEQARIRKAQQLIQSGKATLLQIAFMTGFADQSHFTRRFQIHTGCTPAVYARNKGIRLDR
jgi:AraC family transcriptional regulator